MIKDWLFLRGYELEARGWMALLLVEVFLALGFLMSLKGPVPLEKLGGFQTITLGAHAEHGPIDLGWESTGRWQPMRKLVLPPGLWIRPSDGDTMFDVQSPADAALKPLLETHDELRLWYRPLDCRVPSETTSGGDRRFSRVCFPVHIEVGPTLVRAYSPARLAPKWNVFAWLLAWTALIVYCWRRGADRSRY